MTKKYIVTTYATAEWQCIVEADSEEEAEEKVWAGDYDELNNGDPTDVQDEQIESIVAISKSLSKILSNPIESPKERENDDS